jgi:hypothetical protein
VANKPTLHVKPPNRPKNHSNFGLKGEFARTLNLNDVHIGWVFTRTVRNNAHTHVLGALKAGIHEIPYEITGLDLPVHDPLSTARHPQRHPNQGRLNHPPFRGHSYLRHQSILAGILI